MPNVVIQASMYGSFPVPIHCTTQYLLTKVIITVCEASCCDSVKSTSIQQFHVSMLAITIDNEFIKVMRVFRGDYGYELAKMLIGTISYYRLRWRLGLSFGEEVFSYI